MPKKSCFIVQPMHSRAGNVFDMYLVPALNNDFDLRLPGEHSNSITSDIFRHLREDALVVVNLGAPFRVPTEGNNWLWNPNVMLEAGYRLGLDKPIIFIREKRSQQDEPIAPFDLFDNSIVELLLSAEEEKRDNRQIICTQIFDAAMQVTHNTSESKPEVVDWYSHPFAKMSFSARGGFIVKASDDAAAFYRYSPSKNIIGLDVKDMVQKLTSEMVPSQRAAFQEEQDRLIGALFLGRKPMATVCIVFGNDAILSGSRVDNAYLPIVASFNAVSGKPTILEVLYLNVTAAAVVGTDGVVRCYLAGGCPP